MSWTPHPNSIPIPGWNAGRTGLKNPRTPAVPATLDLTLEEYYAAAATVGLLSAQDEEPDMVWVIQWTHEFGVRMAAESRKRRAAGPTVQPFPRRKRKGR
jgi:hypothetical protein